MPTRRRPMLLLLATMAFAVATAACGGASTRPTATGGKASRAGDTITISNFAFAPEVLTAKVGDTITVDNKDTAEHTVTATDGSFDTGRFAAGTKTFTLTAAGRIEFSCHVHPYMTHAFIQVSG